MSELEVEYKKPSASFPLYVHGKGKRARWAKKIGGKARYFGRCEHDPTGAAALRRWMHEKEDWSIGRRPGSEGEVTIKELCNHFLTSKKLAVDAGHLSPSTLADYKKITDFIVSELGKSTFLSEVGPVQFARLRSVYARGAKGDGISVVTLSNFITKVRLVFKYAYDADLVDRPFRYGPDFRRPSIKSLRIHRAKAGPKMFESDEIRALLENATMPLKAMILLGINCGLGNSDCGQMPLKALDLDGGWINYPRPKTGMNRRCKLWPETIEALREWMAIRRAMKHKSPLVFLTKLGNSWHKDTSDNPISKRFNILLKDTTVDRGAGPISFERRLVGFYALRHTFETIGGECLDQVAVNHIMGHTDSSMAAVYRQRIQDERLVKVTDTVRAWLWPPVLEVLAENEKSEPED